MKIVLLTLLSAGFIFAQGSGTPNCQFNYQLTNRTTENPDGKTVILVSGGTARAPSINNRGGNWCNSWYMSVSVNGFSAVSLSLQDSQNTYTVAGGTPTAWANWEGTVTTGTNPTTATTSSSLNVTGYYPWMSVFLASSTGTGSIDVTLYGWKSPTLLAAGSGSGGAGVAAVSCTYVGSATGTCAGGNGSATFASASTTGMIITHGFSLTPPLAPGMWVTDSAGCIAGSITGCTSAVTPLSGQELTANTYQFTASAVVGNYTVTLTSGGSGPVGSTGATGATGAQGTAGINGTNGTNGSGGNSTVCIPASASGTAYTCPTPSPAVATYTGLIVTLVPDTNSGASPTLNVNALGPKNLKQSDCSTAVSGMVTSNAYFFAYNGTSLCQSAGGSGGSPITITPPTQISGTGCTAFNSGTCVLAYPSAPSASAIAFTADLNAPYLPITNVRRTTWIQTTGSTASPFNNIGENVTSTGTYVVDVPTATSPQAAHIVSANGTPVGWIGVLSHRTGKGSGIQISCSGGQAALTNTIRFIPCGLTSTTSLTNALSADVPATGANMAYIVASSTGGYTSGTPTPANAYMICTLDASVQNCTNIGAGAMTANTFLKFTIKEDIANSQWIGCVNLICAASNTHIPVSGTNVALFSGLWGNGTGSSWIFSGLQLMDDLF